MYIMFSNTKMANGKPQKRERKYTEMGQYGACLDGVRMSFLR